MINEPVIVVVPFIVAAPVKGNIDGVVKAKEDVVEYDADVLLRALI